MQEVRVALPNVLHIVRLYSVNGKFIDFVFYHGVVTDDGLLDLYGVV